LKEKYESNGNITDTENGFIPKQLPDDSIEIIWLNKNHNQGKGCDFIVKKNGTEIEYIEVKTKTGVDSEFIQVTGTQWEFARKLFNENKGDMYCFYIISNAGTLNVKTEILRNPVKLWKEGRIYAHPVNIRF